MMLPANEALTRHLRETLIVKAEVLYLSAGEKLGCQLAGLLTGVEFAGGTLPSDSFDETNIDDVKIEPLAITRCVRGLKQLLLARSLGGGPASDDLDGDFVEQEYLDLLELFLSALPEQTFGGFDWGHCHRGPLRDLLLAGQAWYRLIKVIDEGTQGDFDLEAITATDLALIAGIEVRTLRNLVGPARQLRTIGHFQKPNTGISERSFASINRFDALDWLCRRKDFWLSPLKPGLLATRVKSVRATIDRGRAAIVAAHTLKQSRQALASKLQVSEEAIRGLGDGKGPTRLARQLADYVIELDQERVSDTDPAERLEGQPALDSLH